MYLETFSKWLTTSVLGIILLGAAGSGLTVLLIWLFKKLFRHWLPGMYVSAYKILNVWIGTHAYTHTKLEFDGTSWEINLYFIYHLMIFTLSTIFAGCFLIIFLYGLDNAGESFFIPSVYIPLLLFFLCLIRS